MSEVLQCHAEVLSEECGEVKGYNATIHVDSGAQPRFCKARSVQYAKVKDEQDRLVQQGILEPLQFSGWEAPIVPVLNSDKKSI